MNTLKKQENLDYEKWLIKHLEKNRIHLTYAGAYNVDAAMLKYILSFGETDEFTSYFHPIEKGECPKVLKKYYEILKKN